MQIAHKNGNVLRGSPALNISGGDFTLIFAQNVKKIYMLTSLSIDGGSASINYDREHFGTFELLDSAQVVLKNGTFQSNTVKK